MKAQTSMVIDVELMKKLKAKRINKSALFSLAADDILNKNPLGTKAYLKLDTLSKENKNIKLENKRLRLKINRMIEKGRSRS